MSLVKITTPLRDAKFNNDGFYTCGNYVAVVGFSQHKSDFTVVMIMDHHNNIIIEEVVIKPWGLTLTEQIKQWKEEALKINTKYETQRNN